MNDPISLPSPQMVANRFPLELNDFRWLEQMQQKLHRLWKRRGKQFLLFLGPCSIHSTSLAIEYAKKVRFLQEEMGEEVICIMRLFLEKPRTQFGWKGFLYDPLVDGSNQVSEGLYQSRELLSYLVKQKIPVATEFLDPLLAFYHNDLISWGFIGARTSSSQIHRQMASFLQMPIGFKNDTSGRYKDAILGAFSARFSQVLVGIDPQGTLCSFQSTGNKKTHLVLRGSENSTNYDPCSITQVVVEQRKYGIDSPLLIDCAHGNAKKQEKNQKKVFCDILEQWEEKPEQIFGAMIESHLEGGNALSLTDPCLDWNETEDLILSSPLRRKCSV